MKKLFLVDASNMFFRAYYAIRPLSNSKGQPTNALYGYLSMTIKLLREMKPDYMVYCFDSKEDGFREELYPEYKANRGEMPDDLVPQMPYFKQLTEKLGIPICQVDGVEADDLIGTLTAVGKKNKLEVTIVSGDKDFAQLIGPSVKMMDTMKDVVYDVDGVKQKWGVTPEQMIDYLALIGDASDNIPGIQGVGPKTAQKLLDQYASIEDIYKKIDTVKPDKLREKIKNSRDVVDLSYKLVTILTDLDLKISLDDLRMKPIVREEMLELLNHLEFKSFERKIFGTSTDAPAEPTPASAVETLKTIKASDNADGFEEISVTATELDKRLKKNQILWALPNERGLFVADDKAVYILQDGIEKFRKVFDNKEIVWKGFDLKNFWHSLGLTNPKIAWDHQIAAYDLYPAPVTDFAKVYQDQFHLKLPDFPTPSEMVKFNNELEVLLLEKLEKQNGMQTYEKFDLPLVPVLYCMEKKGVLLDTDILKKQSEGLHKDIRALELTIYEMAEETFNIASPKQLSHILFEKLKLTPSRKTKTGLSTDSDVLEQLEKEHPIARLLIDYRELAKLKSTYVDALPLLVNADDHRLHTVFNQAVTTTGRLSSTNPNLQNIPIRTERGNSVRKAFIADPGCELISADYSQIELRIMAHITEDPGLVRAFENDLDIHAATASEVFGVKLADVDGNLRRVAKAVNFGLAYGMGPHGLATSLGISRTEAADIISKYFMKFARVKNYMSDIVELAKRQGYVETLFGRRRYTPELTSKNAQVRNFGERAAINAPMQGTSSDIVKKAMIDIFQQSKATMILQVHDELVFEVEKDKVDRHKKEIKNLMETVVKLKVPLKVNVSSGKSWFDAH